jgi:hypothetical protein
VQDLQQLGQLLALDGAVLVVVEDVEADCGTTASTDQRRQQSEHADNAHLSMSSLFSRQNLPSASTYSLKSSTPLLSSSGADANV